MVTLKSLNEQIQIHIENGQNLLIGRLPQCDIELEDGSISSQHARLKMQKDLLRVIDMNSTNGTRLNYSLLDGPAYLQDGDTVEFGNMTFTVDGPKLRVPQDISLSAQTHTSLEPIEEAEDMADTMVNMNLSDEEVEDAALRPTENVSSSFDSTETDPRVPLRLAFGIALILILVSGAILFTYLWNSPPRI